MFRITVVDTIIEKKGKIVLVKRGGELSKGMLAIPGGRLEGKETVETAAMREAEEETSLKVRLKQILGVYSDYDRHKRHAIATVFIAEPIEGKIKAGSDAEEVFWVEPNEIEFSKLAFDHAKIIKDYIKWKKKKGTYWSTK